jgi:hypothetical protein
MPCSDGITNYNESPLYVTTERLKECKSRLDAATRAACEMSKHLSENTLRRLSQETFLWVIQHRREDAAKMSNNPHGIDL